jgi:hypothetical protein
MILLHFLLLPIIFLSIFLNPVANGLYVPKMYGYINPQKCLFINESGEEHQIYRFGEFFLFGRVYLLDEQNRQILAIHNEHCPEVEVLEDLHFYNDRIEFKQHVRVRFCDGDISLSHLGSHYQHKKVLIKFYFNH